MTADPTESQVAFDGRTPESHPEDYGWVGGPPPRWVAHWSDRWQRILRWLGVNPDPTDW